MLLYFRFHGHSRASRFALLFLFLFVVALLFLLFYSQLTSTSLDVCFQKLNHKEFLVALIVCYVLRSIPALATPNKRRMSIDQFTMDQAAQASSGLVMNAGKVDSEREEIVPVEVRQRRVSLTGLFSKPANESLLKDNFDLMVAAWLIFDKDGKGYINKNDVTGMMNEEDGGKGTGGDAGQLQEERWKEMDWQHDGTIAFSEFIYTFSRCVRSGWWWTLTSSLPLSLTQFLECTLSPFSSLSSSSQLPLLRHYRFHLLLLLYSFRWVDIDED